MSEGKLYQYQINPLIEFHYRGYFGADMKEIAVCPNSECRGECEVGVSGLGGGIPWDVRCYKCGYHGPYGSVTPKLMTPQEFDEASRKNAIRLHNIICNGPPPENCRPLKEKDDG